MAMPRIGMRQITMGRKLAYATVDSRTASVTAMLCVGPELAMEMTTMSPARRAASLRVPPAWSGDCSPAGAGSLLACDDITDLRLDREGFATLGGHILATGLQI